MSCEGGVLLDFIIITQVYNFLHGGMDKPSDQLQQL